jgi:hypothetical protein
MVIRHTSSTSDSFTTSLSAAVRYYNLFPIPKICVQH